MLNERRDRGRRAYSDLVTLGDVADIFTGPADPDWDADRKAISHEIDEPRSADADVMNCAVN